MIARNAQFAVTYASKIVHTNTRDISLPVQVHETQTDNALSNAYGSPCDYVSVKIIPRDIIAGIVRVQINERAIERHFAFARRFVNELATT